MPALMAATIRAEGATLWSVANKNFCPAVSGLSVWARSGKKKDRRLTIANAGCLRSVFGLDWTSLGCCFGVGASGRLATMRCRAMQELAVSKQASDAMSMKNTFGKEARRLGSIVGLPL